MLLCSLIGNYIIILFMLPMGHMLLASITYIIEFIMKIWKEHNSKDTLTFPYSPRLKRIGCHGKTEC